MTGRSEPAAAMNFDRTASCGLPTTMHPPYHFIGWREGQPATYGEHHRVRNRLAADGRHCCSPCTRVQHPLLPGQLQALGLDPARSRRSLEESHNRRFGCVACCQRVEARYDHRTMNADSDQHDDELHRPMPAGCPPRGSHPIATSSRCLRISMDQTRGCRVTVRPA
jgi:hypothetical protein